MNNVSKRILVAVLVLVIGCGTAAAIGSLAEARATAATSPDPRVPALQAQVKRLTKLLSLTIARQDVQENQIGLLQQRKATLTISSQSGISTTIPGGFQYSTARSLICPFGSQVVGGWYQADHGITPVASYPGVGSDWEVTFWSTLSVAASAKVAAICASVD
jgi:hypothetical protein